MARFADALDTLIEGLDPEQHAAEIQRLRRCRSVKDLDALAEESRGFLTPQGEKVRLRLVKHGTGTFLVLAYEEGWGTTLSQAPFSR